MCKRSIFLFVLVAFSTLSSYSQQVESIPFVEFEKKIAAVNDKTLVINFWATWCRPCVEELPGFEKINAEYADKNVEVWLISLDFHSAVETTLKPFLKKRNIKSRVIHITDTDPNDWIEKVDKNWGGNIPATLVYKSGKRISFHPNQLSYEELVNLISK